MRRSFLPFISYCKFLPPIGIKIREVFPSDAVCWFSIKCDVSKDSKDKYLPTYKGTDRGIVPAQIDIKQELKSGDPVFNIAAYVNKSSCLQELVKLGVNLHKIQCTRGAPEIILRLDFDRDISKYIRFLHDCGVSADHIGDVFSSNPFIFKEDLDNLRVRIHYLQSKKFTPENISRILTKNPRWLSFETQKIDDRLGYFQDKFDLCGPEVRHVAVRMPRIITSKLWHVEENHFSVKEELGFRKHEIKTLILNKPKIFTLSRGHLIERFSYLHSVMGLKNEDLLASPGVLLCRLGKIKERHQFLAQLGLDQYDPQCPGYVSPISIAAGSDPEFCTKVCHVSVDTFNKFLKTLS